MIRTLFLAFLALVIFAPGASAKGVEVGTKIPAIAAKDQSGKEQSFDTLKGTKGITLVFIRSVEWCPFCQRQVMELADNAAKFKDAGYPVVTVSYDTAEKLSAFHSKLKSGVTMLSDPRSEVIKAFGIFNENYAKGTLAYGTPFPGVYVVGADKTVKAKFFKDGVQDRATIDELLASMKEPVAINPADEFPQEENVPASEPVMDTPVVSEEPAQDMLAPAEAVLPTAPEMPVAPDLATPGPMVAPAPEAPVMTTPSIPEPAMPEATIPMPPTAPVVGEPSVEFVPPSEESGAEIIDVPVDEETNPPGGF